MICVKNERYSLYFHCVKTNVETSHISVRTKPSSKTLFLSFLDLIFWRNEHTRSIFHFLCTEITNKYWVLDMRKQSGLLSTIDTKMYSYLANKMKNEIAIWRLIENITESNAWLGDDWLSERWLICRSNCFVVLETRWLTHSLINTLLIDWFIDSFIHSLVSSSIEWLIDRSIN